jgi:hypothetical protein
MFPGSVAGKGEGAWVSYFLTQGIALNSFNNNFKAFSQCEPRFYHSSPQMEQHRYRVRL